MKRIFLPTNLPSEDNFSKIYLNSHLKNLTHLGAFIQNSYYHLGNRKPNAPVHSSKQNCLPLSNISLKCPSGFCELTYLSLYWFFIWTFCHESWWGIGWNFFFNFTTSVLYWRGTYTLSPGFTFIQIDIMWLQYLVKFKGKWFFFSLDYIIPSIRMCFLLKKNRPGRPWWHRNFWNRYSVYWQRMTIIWRLSFEF